MFKAPTSLQYGLIENVEWNAPVDHACCGVTDNGDIQTLIEEADKCIVMEAPSQIHPSTYYCYNIISYTYHICHLHIINLWQGLGKGPLTR